MPEEALQAGQETVAATSTEEVKQPGQAVENGETGTDVDADDANKVTEEAKPKTVEELAAELENTKKAMQKRIDRKTAKEKHLEERLTQLTQQLQSAPKAAEDTGPKPEDFDTYAEYEQATVEHKAKKLADERIKEAKQQELATLRKQQEAQIARDFEAKANAFRELATDYDSVVDKGRDVIGDLVGRGANVEPFLEAMMGFDNPPHMLYELSKDESVLEDIVLMKPMDAMRALVKLEMTLQKPTKETKNAPEPLKTVSSTGKGRKSLDEMSFSEREKYFASLKK